MMCGAPVKFISAFCARGGDMDWQKVSAELSKPLDPKHIKPAPRGKYGDYVDAHHVIEEANRIFGHGGWSYTVTRLAMVSEQTVTLNGNNGPYEQYRVGYMATVQVTVDGVVREGAAVGSGMGSPNTVADHHESAVKEAETDAMKRALRSFGNTFGLALYDKTKANVGQPEPEPVKKVTPAEAEILTDMATRAGTDRAAVFKAMGLPGESWADLPAEWFKGVHKKLQGKLDQMEMQHDAATNNRPPDPAMQAPDAHMYQ